MTSNPIRVAIEQLRAGVEALPEDLEPDLTEGIDGRWDAVGYSKSSVGVPIRDGGSSWLEVAECADDYDDHGRAIAAHIARLASPHVTEALVNLLGVIARADYDNPSSTIEHIEDAAEALATAITRRPE